ncbi:MAG: hypothetical protein EB066_06630, partial [Betaproteobacteria bacterium]|nr:hypothetical protein [Betaproteobacteria bacterium]
GLPTLPFGKGEMRRHGKGVAILAFGSMLYPALKAADNLNASVANMRWAKPLDTELLQRMAASHEALVTIEEGALMGGAGSAVLEALQDAGVNIPVLRLGVPDTPLPWRRISPLPNGSVGKPALMGVPTPEPRG